MIPVAPHAAIGRFSDAGHHSNDLPDIDLGNLQTAWNLETLYVDSVTLNGDALNARG